MINFSIFDADVVNSWISLGKMLALINYIQTYLKQIPIINLLNRSNHFYKHQGQITVFLSFALEEEGIDLIWTSNKATSIMNWKKKTVMKSLMQLEIKSGEKGNKRTNLQTTHCRNTTNIKSYNSIQFLLLKTLGPKRANISIPEPNT